MHDLTAVALRGAHDRFDEATSSKHVYFGQSSMTFIIQIV
jgi:hypothetical protein